MPCLCWPNHEGVGFRDGQGAQHDIMGRSPAAEEALCVRARLGGTYGLPIF
jgi:hypothetical protein